MNGRSVGRPASTRPRVLERFFAACARLEGHIADNPAATFMVAASAVALTEFATRGAPASFDWVWVSGMLAVALGLPAGYRLPDAAARTTRRLADRDVLHGSSAALEDLTNRTADAIGRWLGPVFAAAVLGAFLTRVVAASPGTSGPGVGDVDNNVLEILLGCVAAFLVGRAAGGAVSIALLGRRIEQGPWSLEVQPGHVDGAAGLKPVGDLFFRQAMVIAVPAVWLVAVLALKTLAVVGAEGWSAVLEVVGPGRGWGPWYFVVLVAAVGLEVAAFIVPMVSFHRVMLEQKHQLERETDQDSLRLHELEEELPSITDDTRRRSVEDQIARIREHSLRIEHMPTWPLDAVVRRRFTVRNAILLVPVLANMVGVAVESDSWKTVSDVVGG